jgi:hypothetical protein
MTNVGEVKRAGIHAVVHRKSIPPVIPKTPMLLMQTLTSLPPNRTASNSSSTSSNETISAASSAGSSPSSAGSSPSTACLADAMMSETMSALDLLASTAADTSYVSPCCTTQQQQQQPTEIGMDIISHSIQQFPVVVHCVANLTAAFSRCDPIQRIFQIASDQIRSLLSYPAGSILSAIGDPQIWTREATIGQLLNFFHSQVLAFEATIHPSDPQLQLLRNAQSNFAAFLSSMQLI